MITYKTFMIRNSIELDRIQLIRIIHHDTCRPNGRQERDYYQNMIKISQYRLMLVDIISSIQDNKNFHDDYPKTLAFQVPLRYYGSG